MTITGGSAMGRADTDKMRSLNESKKEFLAKKFGMKLSGAAPGVSPEEEARHLDQVTEIELACATAGEVTVREYLGNPQFKQLAALTPAEIASEIERMENLLQKNNVVFIVAVELTAPERYRVLVNELLDQKIENVRFPIWHTIFMYFPFLGFKRMGVSMDVVGPLGIKVPGFLRNLFRH
jgi:hypothetical protein